MSLLPLRLDQGPRPKTRLLCKGKKYHFPAYRLFFCFAYVKLTTDLPVSSNPNLGPILLN